MTFRDRIYARRRHSDQSERASHAVSWRAVAAIGIVATSAFLAGAQWSYQEAADARAAGRAEAQRQCPYEERLLLTGQDRYGQT
jgi:hypothetical protein